MKPTYSIKNSMALNGVSDQDVISGIMAKLSQDAVSGLAALTNANPAAGTIVFNRVPVYVPATSDVSDANRATVITVNAALVILDNGFDEVQARLNAVATALGVSVAFTGLGAVNGAFENVLGGAIGLAATAITAGTDYVTLITNINAALDVTLAGLNKCLSAMGLALVAGPDPLATVATQFSVALTGGTAAGPLASKVTTDLTTARLTLSSMLQSINAATLAKPLGTFVALK